MGSDYSPLPTRPGAGGFRSLSLSSPTCDMEMMVPTSQGWGLESRESGRESSQLGAS